MAAQHPPIMQMMLRAIGERISWSRPCLIEFNVTRPKTVFLKPIGVTPTHSTSQQERGVLSNGMVYGLSSLNFVWIQTGTHEKIDSINENDRLPRKRPSKRQRSVLNLKTFIKATKLYWSRVSWANFTKKLCILFSPCSIGFVCLKLFLRFNESFWVACVL
jgi:hypothetical protein